MTMGKEIPVCESRATIGFAAMPVTSKQKGASEATRSMPATRIKAGKFSLGRHRVTVAEGHDYSSIAAYKPGHCARGLRRVESLVPAMHVIPRQDHSF